MQKKKVIFSHTLDKQRLTLRQSFQSEETFTITKEVIRNDLRDELSSDSTMDTNNADGYGNEKKVLEPTQPEEKEREPLAKKAGLTGINQFPCVY